MALLVKSESCYHRDIRIGSGLRNWGQGIEDELRKDTSIFITQKPNKLIFLSEAALFLAGPPALGAMGVMPHAWRFVPVFIVMMMVVGRVLQERWSLRDLGIRFENFWSQSFLHHSILTLVCFGGLLAVGHIFNLKMDFVRFTTFKLVMSFLLSVVQEFVFRGFMFPLLERNNFGAVATIVISSLLFAFIHVIYSNPVLFISLSFVFGLAVGTLYYFHRNLVHASICHWILNMGTLYVYIHDSNSL